MEVAAQFGYKDLKSFNAAIAVDPKLHGHSRQQILDLYTKYIDQMNPMLPEFFNRFPKAKLLVLPVEEFREKGAISASYQPPRSPFAPPTYPWQWSAGVLAALAAMSVAVLMTRIRSLDRLR